MKEQHLTYTGCFLNQVAAHYKGNPAEADAIALLQLFFEYGQRAEQIKVLDDFYLAALEQDYRWEHGSPANALHYSERLELLLEAAYLLHQNASGYRFNRSTTIVVPVSELPMLLSAAEYANPSVFIGLFFKETTLLQWKQWLKDFTAAALSNAPITEELEALTVFRFMHQVKKLVYITWRLLALQSANNKAE